MEHLTKAQIVLLTLFVSFVSSMATGIVVVTLMQQAPEPILQTITRVVEKTIEKTIEKVGPAIIEKPGKQTVIKDEDLMVSAIDRNIRSVLAFKVTGEDGLVRSAGIGTIVSSDGLVVTDKKNFGGGVMVTTFGGVRYSLNLVSRDGTSPLGLGRLVPVVPVATSTPVAVFTPVVLGDSNSLKVGQTAIVIGGRDGKTIVNGLITNLNEQTVVDKETKRETKILEEIGLSQRLTSSSNGAPIISLEGVVVGFVSVDEITEGQIGVPVFLAKKLLSQPFSVTPTSSTTVQGVPAKNNLSAGVQGAL